MTAAGPLDHALLLGDTRTAAVELLQLLARGGQRNGVTATLDLYDSGPSQCGALIEVRVNDTDRIEYMFPAWQPRCALSIADIFSSITSAFGYAESFEIAEEQLRKKTRPGRTLLTGLRELADSFRDDARQVDALFEEMAKKLSSPTSWVVDIPDDVMIFGRSWRECEAGA